MMLAGAEAFANVPVLMAFASLPAIELAVSPWPKFVLYWVPLMVTLHVPESKTVSVPPVKLAPDVVTLYQNPGPWSAALRA